MIWFQWAHGLFLIHVQCNAEWLVMFSVLGLCEEIIILTYHHMQSKKVHYKNPKKSGATVLHFLFWIRSQWQVYFCYWMMGGHKKIQDGSLEYILLKCRYALQMTQALKSLTIAFSCSWIHPWNVGQILNSKLNNGHGLNDHISSTHQYSRYN